MYRSLGWVLGLFAVLVGGLGMMNATLMSVFERPLDMHSSDQFDDLGFRVANLADPGPPAVPALSDRGLLATLLCVALIGAVALRSRRRPRAG